MSVHIAVRGRRILAVLFASVVGLALAGAGEAQEAGSGGSAKNVIIFVGDGMGTSHRDLIRYATVGPEGQLAMDDMPYAGRSQTSPLDPEFFVTDSAAGGTAIASGVKTFNGAVGIDAQKNPVPTVLERAESAGKSTGLVSNSQITDATPASFGAHVENRDLQSKIALQYLEESRPEVILGGGEDYWYPEGDPGAHPDEPEDDPEEKSAGTEGNLVQRAEDLGYEYATDAAELRAARGPKLLGLFANEEMFQQNPEGEGAVYDPPVDLSEMTQKAIDTLAADHETGSLAIEDTNELQSDPDYPNESGGGRTSEDGPFDVANSDKRFLVDWTTANHTAEDVPVTASGPGGENLVGVYENTHIHDAMLQALFGSSPPSVSASASASATASASASAGAQVPDTGGPSVAPWGGALAVAVCGMGMLISRRVLRRDG